MRIGVSLYFCAHQRDGVAKSDFMTYPHDFALIPYFSATEGLISFNIGRATRAGAFDWSSPELDPLHDFLVSMVSAND